MCKKLLRGVMLKAFLPCYYYYKNKLGLSCAKVSKCKKFGQKGLRLTRLFLPNKSQFNTIIVHFLYLGMASGLLIKSKNNTMAILYMYMTCDLMTFIHSKSDLVLVWIFQTNSQFEKCCSASFSLGPHSWWWRCCHFS